MTVCIRRKRSLGANFNLLLLFFLSLCCHNVSSSFLCNNGRNSLIENIACRNNNVLTKARNENSGVASFRTKYYGNTIRSNPRGQGMGHTQIFLSAMFSGEIIHPIGISSSIGISSLGGMEDDYNSFYASPGWVVLVALVIGVAAQKWIDTMLKGNDGLGAFLTDGSGYQNSAFKPRSRKEKKEDPMPWLSFLPQLDFVEVAGQETISTVTQQQVEQQRILEEMLQKMNSQLDAGDIQQAYETKQDLEKIMKESGFEFNVDEKK